MVKKSKRTKKRKSGRVTLPICVVKRDEDGKCYVYDERKVYGSAYAACYVVMLDERKCENVADKVAKAVTKIVRNRKQIRSGEIAEIAAREIGKYNRHAAFMYKTHRDIA